MIHKTEIVSILLIAIMVLLIYDLIKIRVPSNVSIVIVLREEMDEVWLLLLTTGILVMSCAFVNVKYSDGVRMSIHHIAHFRHDELVFPVHHRGTVVCDQNGSCGTSGPILFFRESHMMMKTYYAISTEVMCERRDMLVNS